MQAKAHNIVRKRWGKKSVFVDMGNEGEISSEFRVDNIPHVFKKWPFAALWTRYAWVVKRTNTW